MRCGSDLMMSSLELKLRAEKMRRIERARAGMRHIALSVVLLCGFVSGVSAASPLLVVEDPAVLVSLERRALSFSAMLEGPERAGLNNAALMKRPRFKSLVRSLARDLRARKARDPNLGVTMATGRRLFDVRWLRSPHARFELVGIVNRMDRAPFAPKTCGEVRLIYRLAYRKSGPKGEVHSPYLPHCRGQEASDSQLSAVMTGTMEQY